MNPITLQQARVLAHIIGFQRAHRYSPSVRSIGGALGMRSPSTVHQHLGALERKGYIRRDGGQRAITVLKSLPLGAAASVGMPAEQPCPTCGGTGTVHAGQVIVRPPAGRSVLG